MNISRVRGYIQGLRCYISQSKQTANEDQQNAFHLAPCRIEKDKPNYRPIRDIASQLGHPEVKNIGLTGPYGSGKSSILKTLQQDYPAFCYLTISLANLTSNEDDAKEPDALGQRIETQILQQLIYRETKKRLPNSRIARIHHVPKIELNLRTLAFVLSLIALSLNLPSLTGALPWLAELLTTNVPTIAQIYLILYLVYIAGRTAKYVILRTGNVRIRTLHLQGLELQLERSSILMQHLDEIIYFFQATSYNVIIFEDLDRFNSPELFVKLRELNQLLNRSKTISRKVTFIYAVRDDLFPEGEKRTKFFDYITTVIPVINSSNSCDMLKKELERRADKEEVSWLNELDPCIKDLSFYIIDMRLLQNIANEFYQYKETLEANGNTLDYPKLLGMIVLKNYYPMLFFDLQVSKGDVYECIMLRETFLEQYQEENDTEEGATLPLSQLMACIDLDECEELMELQLPPLALYLILSGYIDEDHHIYTSLSYDVYISPNDRRFTQELRISKSHPYDHPVDSIAACYEYIPDTVYGTKACLHIELIHHLATKLSDKRMQKVVDHILDHKAWDFIAQYYEYWRKQKTYKKPNLGYPFDKLFASSKAPTWDDLASYDEQYRNTLTEIWIRYAELEHSTPESQQWIEANCQFLADLDWPDAEELLMELLDKHRYKFESLAFTTAPLLETALMHSTYKLTTQNVLRIANHLTQKPIKEENLNLTLIYGLGDKTLSKYINDNLPHCLANVFTENTAKESSEATILTLLYMAVKDKEHQAPFRDYLKRQRIQFHLDKLDGNLKEQGLTLPDAETRQAEILAFDCDLIHTNWEGVHHYLHEFRPGSTHKQLTQFIEDGVDTLARRDVPKNLLSDLFHAFMLNESLLSNTYEKLLPRFSAHREDAEHTHTLSPDRIKLLIDHSIIPLSPDAITYWSERNSTLLKYYLLHYRNKLIEPFPTAKSKRIVAILLTSKALNPDEKKTLIQHLTPEYLEEEQVCNTVIELILAANSPLGLPDEPLKKLFIHSTLPDQQKLKLVNLLLQQNNYQDEQIDQLLILLPKPYNNIGRSRAYAVIQYTKEGEELCQLLKEKGYINSFERQKGLIIISY
ncbi:MAG: hypothetical protein CSA97_01525 [Bacteroidetes bacterium]|nr:MAG: hypothetical protein CSA97_01525 [Bacteroidota bacterium]